VASRCRLHMAWGGAGRSGSLAIRFMTAIWFILAAMTAAAVLGLLWPMSRRAAVPAGEVGGSGLATETAFYEDQIAEIGRDLERGLIAPEEAETAKAEAARRLLRASREAERAAAQDGVAEAARPAEPRLRRRRAASAFALSTIPLVALIAYGLYGSPELPAQTEADRQAARGGADELMKAVGQIEARLARDPNDARGWAVLAPVYMRTGRFDDAARAYGNIARIKGESADILADQAEALTAAGAVREGAGQGSERAQAPVLSGPGGRAGRRHRRGDPPALDPRSGRPAGRALARGGPADSGPSEGRAAAARGASDRAEDSRRAAGGDPRHGRRPRRPAEGWRRHRRRVAPARPVPRRARRAGSGGRRPYPGPHRPRG
jgi:cytochrome c-type biogenesis protein CcmH